MKMIALQIQNDEFIIYVAKPGENVKVVVKVSPTEEEFVGKGSVISHPISPCVVTSEIVAQLVILQLLETKVSFVSFFLSFPPDINIIENFYCCLSMCDTSWDCCGRGESNQVRFQFNFLLLSFFYLC
jgi:translation elongation factor EF-1alpha